MTLSLPTIVNARITSKRNEISAGLIVCIEEYQGIVCTFIRDQMPASLWL